MTGLWLVQFAIVASLTMISLIVAITVGVKALRSVRRAWYKSHYRSIEPALENYLLTGEPQPELERLRPWQRDRFLSTLMVERIALLRGDGKEHLMWLATDLGLVERYLGALQSRRRWQRARAAENLGYLGGPKAARPLSALLSDEDETVRAVAARALARIGTEEAVLALARTLGTPSELTRLRAAENLERIGPASIGPLVESLAASTTSEPAQETHTEPRDAVMAARVLGNLRAAQARDALLLAVRTSDDENLRARATQALGRIGDPEDVPTLLKAAGDEAWPVRAQAVNALGLIGEASSVPTLKDIAADEAWWVRRNTCSALANMGPEGEKALVELLKGHDRYARDQAAATLEVRGFTRRAVRNLAKTSKRGERAYDTVAALVGAGATRQLTDLAEVLPEGEERHLLRELLGDTVCSEPRVLGDGTNEAREEIGLGKR